MKKLFCILTAMLLMISVAACGQDPAPGTEPPETTSAPAETEPGEVLGTMQVDILANLDESAFQEVHRFVINAEGENIALFNDAFLRDVRVEWGTLDADGTEFVVDHLIWSADRMEPGTLIVVSAWLSDVVPNIRVSYTGAAGETVQTVFQSGKDGSMLLYE